MVLQYIIIQSGGGERERGFSFEIKHIGNKQKEGTLAFLGQLDLKS